MATLPKSYKNAIRIIEYSLGIKFKGKTKGEAAAFIKEHIEASKEKNVDPRKALPIPKKVKDAINFIEETIFVKFEGNSLFEASEFLDKYLKVALEKKDLKVNKAKEIKQKLKKKEGEDGED